MQIRAWGFSGLRDSGLRSSLNLGLSLGLLMLTGCASGPSHCPRDLKPQWVDMAQLRQDVAELASEPFAGRKNGTEGSRLAQQLLARRFEEAGLMPAAALGLKNTQGYLQPFDFRHGFSDRHGANLVGILPAATPSKRWRVILGHYDHLGGQGRRYYPGADDNASGTAALLALASHGATDTQRAADINWLFAATDAEELGLYGGKALVQWLQAQGLQVEAAINLDMVGHPGRPYAIYLEGARNFSNIDALLPGLKNHGLCVRLSHSRLDREGNGNINWLKASDHYPFHQAGIPWLYFGVPPHPQYHSMDDTPDRLDYGFLAAVVEAVYPLLSKPLVPKTN
ncbi:M28 family peptidase [Shewanella sedimentimangrovi]|uniref:M28 family peptidase n=1 Tax=Shewanella sedimentimangrovi TaxID=2814293 RepID=A0ABX7R4X6_9GAMM|nr:M28 family peptidase [Shewanella sedimentimangrovi]